MILLYNKITGVGLYLWFIYKVESFLTITRGKNDQFLLTIIASINGVNMLGPC